MKEILHADPQPKTKVPRHTVHCLSLCPQRFIAPAYGTKSTTWHEAWHSVGPAITRLEKSTMPTGHHSSWQRQISQKTALCFFGKLQTAMVKTIDKWVALDENGPHRCHYKAETVCTQSLKHPIIQTLQNKERAWVPRVCALFCWQHIYHFLLSPVLYGPTWVWQWDWNESINSTKCSCYQENINCHLSQSRPLFCENVKVVWNTIAISSIPELLYQKITLCG